MKKEQNGTSLNRADLITFTDEYEIGSPEEMEAFGAALGRATGPNSIIALIGGLGAGKTTITRGIALGLEVKEIIPSPTFVLMYEHQGRIPLFHFDFWTLDAGAAMDRIS